MNYVQAGDEIVNTLGIAQRLGVTKSCVANWRTRYADFPEPLDMPGVVGIPLFSWWDVRLWAGTHERGACEICGSTNGRHTMYECFK